MTIHSMKIKTLLLTTFRATILALLSAATVFAQTASAQVRYQVIDLGADGTANQILDSGRVMGSHNPGGTDRHAAFWPDTQSAPIDLGTLPGNQGSRGFGINTQGQMVGYDYIPNVVQHAIFWADSQSAPIELPGLPEGFNNASDINRDGQIVGTATPPDESAAYPVFWSSSTTPARYLAEVSDQLPFGGAMSINATGNILGDACRSDYSECHAAYWASSTSTPVALASPGGNFTNTDVGLSGSFLVAHSLNDRGGMVGFAYNADATKYRAVYWASSSSPAVMLTTTKDFPNGSAEGINNRGQIVGTCYNRHLAASHAFIWPNSTHHGIDLNRLIDPNSGWEIVVARSINDKGEISGGAFLNGIQTGHAVILVPTQ